MGRLSRILLAFVVGVIPVGVFGYLMGYPGLNEFVGYPILLKVAYAGCALAALVMGPGALAFAAMGGSSQPKAAKPKKEKVKKEKKSKKDKAAPADDGVDDLGDGEGISDGDDFGDDAWEDDGVEDFESDDFEDGDLAFDELDDDEFK